MNQDGQLVFYYPTIRSEQWTPRGRSVLVRAEQPPARASSIWTPQHRETEGRALGFVVYGTVVRVGPGEWEPAWVTDTATGATVRDGQQKGYPRTKFKVMGSQGPEDRERVDPGKLVWHPTSVKVGERVVWSHGWGPLIELADGVHFSIHENGLHASWTDEHVHCPHLSHDFAAPDGPRVFCCDDACEWTVKLGGFETNLPSCGAGARGYPRLAEAIVGVNPVNIPVPFADDPTPDPDEIRERLLVREGESDR